MINVLAAANAAVLAAGGEGGEEMPSVLAVPIDELIIGIIAFLIVFGGLAKIALPKIKATLDERADAIEGGIERAAKAEADGLAQAADYAARCGSAVDAESCHLLLVSRGPVPAGFERRFRRSATMAGRPVTVWGM